MNKRLKRYLQSLIQPEASSLLNASFSDQKSDAPVDFLKSLFERNPEVGSVICTEMAMRGLCGRDHLRGSFLERLTALLFCNNITLVCGDDTYRMYRHDRVGETKEVRWNRVCIDDDLMALTKQYKKIFQKTTPPTVDDERTMAQLLKRLDPQA
jgi:hypothetical protein